MCYVLFCCVVLCCVCGLRLIDIGNELLPQAPAANFQNVGSVAIHSSMHCTNGLTRRCQICSFSDSYSAFIATYVLLSMMLPLPIIATQMSENAFDSSLANMQRIHIYINVHTYSYTHTGVFVYLSLCVCVCINTSMTTIYISIYMYLERERERETGKVMTMGLYIFRHTHANARMSTNLNPRSGMPMFACPVVFMRTRFPFLTFTGLCWGPFFSFFRSSWLMLALLGAILAHLVALGSHVVAKLLQDGAKMAQHSPT